MGGFVAGDSNLIDVLWNTARTQFFSTALPPAVCAAAVASLRVMRRDQDRLRRLHDRCQLARQIVADRGLVSIDGSQGPIVPIVTGADDLAVGASQKLMNAGFFVPAIRPPTVPTGTARLRMSINCEHSESQIEQAVSEICKAVN